MSASLNDTHVSVLLSHGHHKLSFNFTDKAFFIRHDLDKPNGKATSRTHEISHESLLRVAFDSDSRTLSVSYLKPKTSKKQSTLVMLNGTVQGEQSNEEITTWAEAIMKALYEDQGIQRSRRLLIFVNPHGGVGKGVKIFNKVVEPILRAADCKLTVVKTERHGHAFDYVKTHPLEYDAIATVSGDGLIHEVLNGLAEHAEPIRALNIPLAPIPAGSGNGLSLNLIGIEKGFDSAAAALNIIKGRAMHTDLFSVTQEGKRSLSFMSQSLGLMADLDLDTEHLRWMGDARFFYGLVRGLVTFKPCPIQLSVKIAERDKQAMADAFHAHAARCSTKSSKPEDHIQHGTGLPPLKHLPDDKEGWYTVDEPILFAYAGQGPYVGRDYMAFPVSLPDDGLIDISILPLTSRADVFATIGGAETGENFWHSNIQYFKAHAYRVKTLAETGNLSVDGERFPFKEFQVEVHPRLGTFLSLHGRYATELKARPMEKK